MSADEQARVAATTALTRRARRMGPLPWSALGVAPPAPLPAALAGWLAAALDARWEELGRPDPFVVVDAGAGDGERAAAVMGHRPVCAPALRWLLVDASPGADARQQATLRRWRATGGAPGAIPVLEDPALVLGPVVAGDDPDEPPASPPGIGPLAASLADLPGGLSVAVVLAVGWLGRLPADRFEWCDGRWWEVRLAAGPAGDELAELLVDAGERAPTTAASTTGTRVAHPAAARRWLAAARRVASAGRVVAIDAFSPTLLPPAELGAPPLHTIALPEEVGALSGAEWDMQD